MFAAYVYTGLARDLVHQLKYGGTTALAGAVAALLADRMGKHGIGADILVPVPLSGLRHRTRGYNQSEVLARRLAAELKLPLDVRTLRRRRHTPSQASSSDAGARHRNVQDAFETRGNGLAGRRVLLVDDVTTTGATLSACASAAKAGGAREVCAIAFARED